MILPPEDFIPILVQKPGKESGDIWVLTGYWNGEKNVTGDWTYVFLKDGYEWEFDITFKFPHLDGASVPDFVAPVVHMGGRDMPDQAWVPHDAFYWFMRNYGYIPNQRLRRCRIGQKKWEPVLKVCRPFVDEVFRNELAKPKHGLASFKPGLAYLGVRAGGGPDWPC